MSRLLSALLGLLQERNLAASGLKKKIHIYRAELSLGSLTPNLKCRLVAHQTLSGSEIVWGRTYVDPRSDKNVNANAATELGAR